MEMKWNGAEGIKNNPYEKEKNISLINKKIKQDKNIFP